MALRKPNSIEECKLFSKQFISKRGSKDQEGRAFLWVFKGEDVGNVEYTCPYCGHEGEIQQEFNLPFKFRCEKCEKAISIKKLSGKGKKK
jgi:hypothetical protein